LHDGTRGRQIAVRGAGNIELRRHPTGGGSKLREASQDHAIPSASELYFYEGSARRSWGHRTDCRAGARRLYSPVTLFPDVTAIPMTIRTTTDTRYYTRFLLIGAAAFAFSLWSLYDGAVKYPKKRQWALAFQELAADGRENEWFEYARQRGWPIEPPDKLITDADITTQYIMAVVAATAGVVLLVVVWRARGRWIELNESGLESSWGQHVALDRVICINKKRWRDKGIAKIKYEHGRWKRRFVLDNYKYDRPTTDMILYEIEAEIGADKIVGGPPEPPPEEPGEDVAESVAEELANSD